MEAVNYNVLGVMSGTSLDGIDIAHIFFSFNEGKWSFTIHEADTIPYTAQWIRILKEAVGYSDEQLIKLNKEYTVLLADAITSFIQKYNLTAIDAVCSHGHTILHQPEKRLTLQIGNMPEIAQYTGLKTVCDFRVQDVQLGGQGAPLVPIGDMLLFPDYYYCLNLGGFSNISFTKYEKRIAFDICAVNTVLNYYAGKLGYEYDDRGRIATSGNLNNNLLDELNSLDYYRQPYPKSLGFEYVKQILLPLIDNWNISAEDALSTFTEHIAIQIAAVINAEEPNRSLLITGGGAYNEFLINRLQSLLSDTLIKIPDDKTIQYKEALIFGFLGVLKMRNDINVLSSVTGAKYNHSSGMIFIP